VRNSCTALRRSSSERTGLSFRNLSRFTKGSFAKVVEETSGVDDWVKLVGSGMVGCGFDCMVDDEGEDTVATEGCDEGSVVGVDEGADAFPGLRVLYRVLVRIDWEGGHGKD
jgi:hypothetical protein